MTDKNQLLKLEPYIRARDFCVFNRVGVCALTKTQFIEEVFSIPVEPISATVVLVGVPAIISAKENVKIAEMYNSATIAAIDGMPIVNMGRRKGFHCERCAAPDIMGPIFAESVKRNKSHYFYGGKDDITLVSLRNNLERDYPRIRIVGMHSPPFRALTKEEDIKICNEINDAHPDFLWVGIGAPKQELWMWEHQDRINKTIMIGVGAGFNYLAGTLNKAPEWMEKASLEWLFRLSKEPKRLWKRYTHGGIKFIFYTVQSKFKQKL